MNTKEIDWKKHTSNWGKDSQNGETVKLRNMPLSLETESEMEMYF